jgi:hypothetical protein
MKRKEKLERDFLEAGSALHICLAFEVTKSIN